MQTTSTTSLNHCISSRHTVQHVEVPAYVPKMRGRSPLQRRRFAFCPYSLPYRPWHGMHIERGLQTCSSDSEEYGACRFLCRDLLYSSVALNSPHDHADTGGPMPCMNQTVVIGLMHRWHVSSSLSAYSSCNLEPCSQSRNLKYIHIEIIHRYIAGRAANWSDWSMYVRHNKYEEIGLRFQRRQTHTPLSSLTSLHNG